VVAVRFTQYGDDDRRGDAHHGDDPADDAQLLAGHARTEAGPACTQAGLHAGHVGAQRLQVSLGGHLLAAGNGLGGSACITFGDAGAQQRVVKR